MIDARHVTLNLPILRLKNGRANQMSTLKGHSTRPYPMCARTGLNCSGSLPYLAWITFCIRIPHKIRLVHETRREWWDRNTKTLTMGGKMSKHKKSSTSTRSKDRRKEKGPKGASPTPPSGKQ